MILEYLTVGPFAENSYILGDEETGDGILIDPGHDPKAILARVKELKLTISAIVNTHAHIDHVGGVEEVQRRLGVPFALHRKELPLLEALPMQAQMFGLPPIRVPQVDDWLTAGQRLKVGGIDITVIETPGHSPGSVTLKVERAGVEGLDLIAGDVLFAGSIGRTDLPGGDYDTLIRSITGQLFPLGDECRVWPGHGPDTTIGAERRTNPFVGGM